MRWRLHSRVIEVPECAAEGTDESLVGRPVGYRKSRVDEETMPIAHLTLTIYGVRTVGRNNAVRSVQAKEIVECRGQTCRPSFAKLLISVMPKAIASFLAEELQSGLFALLECECPQDIVCGSVAQFGIRRSVHSGATDRNHRWAIPPIAVVPDGRRSSPKLTLSPCVNEHCSIWHTALTDRVGRPPEVRTPSHPIAKAER